MISSSFGSYKHRQKKKHPFMIQPLIYWKKFNGEKGSHSMLIKYSLAFLANKVKLTRRVKIWVYEPIYLSHLTLIFFCFFLHQYFVNKIFSFLFFRRSTWIYHIILYQHCLGLSKNQNFECQFSRQESFTLRIDNFPSHISLIYDSARLIKNL